MPALGDIHVVYFDDTSIIRRVGRVVKVVVKCLRITLAFYLESKYVVKCSY